MEKLLFPGCNFRLGEILLFAVEDLFEFFGDVRDANLVVSFIFLLEVLCRYNGYGGNGYTVLCSCLCADFLIVDFNIRIFDNGIFENLSFRDAVFQLGTSFLEPLQIFLVIFQRTLVVIGIP